MNQFHVFASPPAFDVAIRRVALTSGVRALRKPLWPLFPIGLPGGYITVAYATAHCLKRRGQHGGSAIVMSAWLGWLVHRGVKLILVRERPPERGRKRRFDSYPSGHTTGATALALTMARVLHREGAITNREAMAIAAGAPLVMGAYRVIADDHWATDVLAGWVLGAAISLMVSAPYTRPRCPRIRQARPKFAG
jgi:membrane-associated phospholipid phosphatase